MSSLIRLAIVKARTLSARLLPAVFVVLTLLGTPTGALAAANGVSIAQSPLTVRQPVPPNIVLMLDDSGSMMWDVMPDWNFLRDHSDLGLINAGVNGVYYNPSVNYTPPPLAAGGNYPDASFDHAKVNGFDERRTAPRADLTKYTGKYDASIGTSTNSSHYPNSGGSKVSYSIDVTVTGNRYQAGSCPSGAKKSGLLSGLCYYSSNPLSHWYDFKGPSSKAWYVSRCQNKEDVYDEKNNVCYVGGTVTTTGKYNTCGENSSSIGETRISYYKENKICSKAYSFFTYSTSKLKAFPTGSYAASSSCPEGTKASASRDGFCYYSNGLDGRWFNFKAWVGSLTYYRTRCNTVSDVFNQTTDRCLASQSVSLSQGVCPSGKIKVGKTLVDDEDRNICVSEASLGTGIASSTDDSGIAVYVRHYVGKSGSCAAAGLSADVCVDPSQVQPSDPSVQVGMSGTEVLQNVANWFSYYHTRMLMAKSGLMRAFSSMGESYRFGFSSINQNNRSGLPSDSHSYGPSTDNDNRTIANVTTFGDGTAGTQKANFWSWVAGEFAYGSTPLRESLQAVGEYYRNAQPWQSATTSTGESQLLSCRQSYAILTTDGFWNGGSTNVENADGNDGPEISVSNGQNFSYSPKSPFKDSNDGTLADVAMYYWNHDLADGKGGSPDIDNLVPTTAIDPASWQHMVTFTIGMGFLPPYKSKKYTKNPNMTRSMVDGLFNWAATGKKPSVLDDWAGWLKPKNDSGEINNINDLVHAGVNGRGGFFSATSPQSFASGLQSALNRARERSGTAASLAASSTQLKTGTEVYQAKYHTSKWTGDLFSYDVDPDDGSIAKSENWNAAQGITDPNDRHIYTFNPSKGSGAQGYVAFKQDNLGASEVAALGDNAVGQTNMVKYLRGDNSPDGDDSNWRYRKSLLGDIVNSQPVYVGQVAPNAFAGRTFSGSSSFSAWAASQAGRAPRIYVAANDGMLHAFDVTDGAETYAYMPAAVITSGIKALANPDYGTTAVPHQFFNDGQMTVADAYFNSAWHTVLVGTTGRGEARAVYALDVTDPDNIGFLWERSAGDGKAGSDYIGQITGKPIVAQVEDGDWAVLLGNGYNSTKGVAALLQFNLANGNLSVHKTNDGVPQNGLATPGVWLGDKANNISTVAYAGDNQGNVWSFEISNDDSGTPTATPTSSGIKVYAAKDGDGNVQPITAGMLLGKNPKTGDLWVFFGTGRDLAATDRSGVHLQSWYGLIVKSASSSGPQVTAASTRSDLAMRKIIYQLPNAAGELGKRVMSQLSDDDSSKQGEDIAGKQGWYIDLAYNGVKKNETMVTPNQFQGNLLIGTSRVPVSTDACNPGGVGWTMALDPFTGTNPQDTYFDVNRDGKFNDADTVTIDGKTYVVSGLGFNSIANDPISIGNALEISLHDGETETIQTQGGGGGLSIKSWRELVNP